MRARFDLTSPLSRVIISSRRTLYSWDDASSSLRASASVYVRVSMSCIVLHPYHYSSGEAQAVDHIHQHLLRGEYDVPSLGTPAMATVVQRMILSGLYNVQTIPERPGYFRVIPQTVQKPIPPPSSSWHCGLIFALFLCGVLLAVAWAFYLQTRYWRAFIETAVHRGCSGFPCFACTERFASLFAYTEGFPRKCLQCCG